MRQYVIKTNREVTKGFLRFLLTINCEFEGDFQWILNHFFDIGQSFRQIVEIGQNFGHILPKAWPTFDEKISQIG
jgi:hypothetical protein